MRLSIPTTRRKAGNMSNRPLVISLRIMFLFGLLAVAVGCGPVGDVTSPEKGTTPPTFVFGEGTSCEAATAESFRWCYITFAGRALGIEPGPSCVAVYCWATFPVGPVTSQLWGARDFLLGSSNATCRLAGARFAQLLNEDRVSYWIPQDVTPQGGTVLGITWTAGGVVQSVAMQFWRTMLDNAPQGRVNWEVAHELGHDIMGPDEIDADAFAIMCVGFRPLWNP